MVSKPKRVNMKKYVLLPFNDSKIHTEWDAHSLRMFAIRHICAIKAYLERKAPPILEYQDFTVLAFWLLYDLEMLGKVKSAEKIYIRLLALGVIRGN